MRQMAGIIHRLVEATVIQRTRRRFVLLVCVATVPSGLLVPPGTLYWYVCEEVLCSTLSVLTTFNNDKNIVMVGILLMNILN